MAEVTPTRRRGLLWRWAFVMRTCNPPPGRVDPLSRWLVLTRACVLPMTLTSAAVAGLLAAGAHGFRADLFALAAVGLLLAHAANNLMNDLFDLEGDVSTEGHPRALYAPHPVASGMISRKGLVAAVLVVNLLSLAVLVTLTIARDPWVVAFALGGFAVSAGYAAPPIRLKKRGLGEPGVLLVWGPLMVGGTYYASVGTVGWQVLAASVPYGLLATAVLMGKHIDKLPWDAGRGVGTLPAILGEARARAVTLGMMVAFYPCIVALVVAGALPVPALIVGVALLRLRPVWKAFRRPRPETRPHSFPVWPLWYTAHAFVHTRRAGALFLLGLAAGLFLPDLY